MVHQHFMLVPVFTVTENVMLGVESTRGPLRIIDKAAGEGQDPGDLGAAQPRRGP